ncbi:MAG: carboxylesterase family protein, partial [Acidobacteriota bacterium]|jgi:para-nitrobenzyl esterase
VREGQVLAFRGIPFAAPPVGAARWVPPQPVQAWVGVRPAAQFGPPCPQVDDAGRVIGEEDCLHLNVWTPAAATTASRLPVLFFIHGGGHVQGSASVRMGDGTYLYDGARLAGAVQAVVVTAQYRLGALGFLAHPALVAGHSLETSGNYGTLDLVAALGWVQRHIVTFGGDPRRVLVFGESAGAVETCALLVAPLARGLFSAALMQSGACVAASSIRAARLASDFVDASGCGGAVDLAACLRELVVPTVVTAVPAEASVVSPASGWFPHVDGVVIPAAPLALLQTGRHNRVPLVVGSNRDETSMGTVTIVTEAHYQAAVLALTGGNAVLASRILAAYPVAEYGSPRKAFTALTSDANFICPARRVARAAAAGQREPVFRYFFTHPWDNASAAQRALGAFHGIELVYVFRRLDAMGYRASPGEVALGEFIGAAWRALAAHGNPSPVAGPAWPEYDPVTDPFLELTTPPAPGQGVRTPQCDFWDTLSDWRDS